MSEKVGTWPQVCVQRAFVEGASWWIWANGSTPFPAERDLMETEALRRYGEPSAELAAAEERGRRRGVEEAIRKAEAYFKLHTSQPQDLIRALHAALAPRDSGKEPE